MTVSDAIGAAERILPGETPPEPELDPRRPALTAVSEFIRSDRDAVWAFIEKWGCNANDELRMIVATYLLEHFLEHHFEDYIARVEQLALSDANFADTVSHCWAFGRTEFRRNRKRFENLKRRIFNSEIRRGR
jgi:hypothetical protein